MLFNSGSFLLFFIVTILVYYTVPKNYRNIIVLIASYIFYCTWEVRYLLLLLFVTASSYAIALKFQPSETSKSRKVYLYSYIAIAIGLLVFFKYLNFFNDSLRSLSQLIHIEYPVSYLDILLPVGISFFTFESLSYVLDVYYGRRLPEKHFLNYALFISFFPKLLAGPIERAHTLLPQFEKQHAFDYNNLSMGVKRVLWGLFKKVVIADRLALFIDRPFEDPTFYGAPTLLFVAILFTIQLYCDFSGYTDMAIGTARIMGFRLMENFKNPFSSEGVTEFWRRWHISLSTWIRDYLYNPLLLNFTRNIHAGAAVIMATLISFTLIGLWHGDNWKYVVFGWVHFMAITYEYLSSKKKKILSKMGIAKVYSGIAMLLTFLFIVLTFTLIKANTAHDAWDMVQRILSWNTSHFEFSDFAFRVGEESLQFSLILLVVFALIEKPIVRDLTEEKPLRWGALSYAFVAATILLFGVFHHAKFIYFQF